MNNQEAISNSAVVIDCTGKDDVLYHLKDHPWRKSATFFSISLGFGARRLFCYAEHGILNPEVFFAKIRKWLEKERKEQGGKSLPREGIGCWHPVFPARADEVWMMTTFAVKFIETYAENPPTRPILKVYEQIVRENIFVGAQEVHEK